jgi:predicted dehydrogenase
MIDFKNRRSFLKSTFGSALVFFPFISEAKSSKIIIEKPKPSFLSNSSAFDFAVIGINHGHIYSMSLALKNAGANLSKFYAAEEDLARDFQKRFPDAKRVTDPNAIYEDKSIRLIASAAIPNLRADIAIKAMLHDKDVMLDKPGITDLFQLKQIRKTIEKTQKIVSICYSERFENKATERASELVQVGAIGRVIQTLGTGPHRINAPSRPDWFWDKKYFGGIITDIASHQIDQFLHFTGSTSAKILSAQIGNVNHKNKKHFQDFGDVTLQGNAGSGYHRVDWFTPDGLKTWGDGRLTILGTEGYIEIRKNIDITKKDSGSHLYLVNQKETLYIDCSQQELPYGKKLVADILNRTATAMSQEHCLLATELALKAQKQATLLS